MIIKVIVIGCESNPLKINTIPMLGDKVGHGISPAGDHLCFTGIPSGSGVEDGLKGL